MIKLFFGGENCKIPKNIFFGRDNKVSTGLLVPTQKFHAL